MEELLKAYKAAKKLEEINTDDYYWLISGVYQIALNAEAGNNIKGYCQFMRLQMLKTYTGNAVEIEQQAISFEESEEGKLFDIILESIGKLAFDQMAK